MKLLTGTLIIAALVGATTFAAVAENDYVRLKRDVNVMTQILKGAFETDEDCRGCRVRTDGLYLAKQGFVFTVKDVDGRWFQHHGDSDGMSFSFNTSEFRAIQEIEAIEEIPHMVERIVADVTNAMPDIDVDVDRIVAKVESSTREAMRDLRRSRRDLQQEIREQEIELIHADDSERGDIENSIASLETRMQELEQKEETIEARAMEQREKMRQRIEEKRQAQEQRRRDQQAKVQSRVLQAFCDYGSTLQSLPSSEKVTVIFANDHGHEEQDTIYVFDRGDIVNCNRDSDKLQRQALKYQF